MKTKKSKNANLENFRTIFLQIGLILTLSAILFAFEWKSSIKIEKLSNKGTTWIDIEDLPPVTRPEPEKKVVKPPVPIEKLIIEKDDVIIEEEPIFQETEIDWDDAIEIIEFDETEEKVVEEFVKVEIMPTFLGKNRQHFRSYVAGKVKFPISAIESGVNGTVYASFVIDEDGNVIKVEITRRVHPVVDQAVIDAIKSSPQWEPGIQDGKYVRVKYAIAIAFILE